MKLQLALDIYDIPQSLALLNELADVIDIVEIGTPMIIREGVHAVKAIKEKFPNLLVLADLKIMDGGKMEAVSAFQAGADIVTVLSVAEDATIKNVVEAGQEYGKLVMADMIAVCDLPVRALELDGFGLDYLCVHTAFDIQDTRTSPLEQLKQVKNIVKRTKVAVAGGVKLQTLNEIVAEKPDIVIVGMGIANHPERRAAAMEMKRIMNL